MRADDDEAGGVRDQIGHDAVQPGLAVVVTAVGTASPRLPAPAWPTRLTAGREQNSAPRRFVRQLGQQSRVH